MAHSILPGENLLGEQELGNLSAQHMRTILQSEPQEFDIVVIQFNESPEWLAAWEKEHQEIIKHLSEAKTAPEQKIALRKESLALIENCAITQPFLRDGLSDEEMEILLKHRHPEFSLQEAQEAQLQMYILSDASLRVLHRLSAEFADAEKDDWYDLCMEIHQQHIGHLYRQTIAQLTGNKYNFESLVDVLHKMIDEVEAKVLDGKPWNFANKLKDVRQFATLQTSPGFSVQPANC